MLSAIGSAAPWLVAVAGFALAASLWEPAGPVTMPPEVAALEELRDVRLALAASNAENLALRRELDRLLARRIARPAAVRSRDDVAASFDGPPGESSDDRQRMGEAFGEVLPRALSGDPEGTRELREILERAARDGERGFESLRDVYLLTSDPKLRQIMLPMIAYVDGERSSQLVMSELDRETDPVLRHTLLMQAANLATPGAAGSLREAFLHEYETAADPAARATAIHGLRYALGTEVHEAIADATADPSEEVRVAAIAHLASRASGRDLLRDLVRAEASPRVRKFAECQLLVAESLRWPSPDGSRVEESR